jgi:hypothetical protein
VLLLFLRLCNPVPPKDNTKTNQDNSDYNTNNPSKTFSLVAATAKSLKVRVLALAILQVGPS